MKRFLSLIALSALVAALSACACEHEWAQADCTTPKTCTRCGESEGEPLGHVWSDPDCENPKTCSRCGATEGEALGHDWLDATCDLPKTCAVCAATEGDALGHDWLDATLDAPMTCSRCALTDGYPLSPDERFDHTQCEAFFGTWHAEYHPSGDLLGDGFGEFLPELPAAMELSFGTNGVLTMTITLEDEAALMEAMNLYTIDLMYSQFAEMGLDEAAADEAFSKTYDMTIEEYVAIAMSEVEVSDIFTDTAVTYVYYVSDGILYMADSWDGTFETDAVTVDGDTLTVDLYADGSPLVDFTRVKE